eukprot:jgi/Mesvir1/21271/Mv21671-RA.2
MQAFNDMEEMCVSIGEPVGESEAVGAMQATQSFDKSNGGADSDSFSRDNVRPLHLQLGRKDKSPAKPVTHTDATAGPCLQLELSGTAPVFVEAEGAAVSTPGAQLSLLQQIAAGGPDKSGNGCGESGTDSGSHLDEIFFLMLHFLSSRPDCAASFAALKADVAAHGLLGMKHSWDPESQPLPASYADFLPRYGHLSTDRLPGLLEELRQVAGGGRPFVSLLADREASVVRCERQAALHARATPAVASSTGTSSSYVRPRALGPSTGTSPVLTVVSASAGTAAVNCLFGLRAREMLGGLEARHKRAPLRTQQPHVVPSRATLYGRMNRWHTFRGHMNIVYCGIFDKTGRRVVTGSDDRLVKIWSTLTGMLCWSCRGHTGDITDLAISPSNDAVASASNDGSVRVWHLATGRPVSVHLGHTAAVHTVVFIKPWSIAAGEPAEGHLRGSPGAPRPQRKCHLALVHTPDERLECPICAPQFLSCSDDGTVMLWRVSLGSPLGVYTPSPAASLPDRPSTGPEGASAPPPPAGPASAPTLGGILCMSLSWNSRLLVTGHSCPEDSAALSESLVRVWHIFLEKDGTTGFAESSRLKGHRNEVNHVSFSHLSERRLLTCSRDGTLRLWGMDKRCRKLEQTTWVCRPHHILKVAPVNGGTSAPTAASRRVVPPSRRPPELLQVNMASWSLDDRWVLALASDGTFRVWRSHDGALIHCLSGHSKPAYVLECSPIDANVVMTAGYDGTVIMWDIVHGSIVHRFHESGFNLVDAKFSPCGTSFVVSDDVGQCSLYSVGSKEGTIMAPASYDQFLKNDYAPLLRDTHGFVMDVESQAPPHIAQMREPLCMADGHPYPPEFQMLYRSGRVSSMPRDLRAAMELSVRDLRAVLPPTPTSDRGAPGRGHGVAVRPGVPLALTGTPQHPAGMSAEDMAAVVASVPPSPAPNLIMPAELAAMTDDDVSGDMDSGSVYSNRDGSGGSSSSSSSEEDSDEDFGGPATRRQVSKPRRGAAIKSDRRRRGWLRQQEDEDGNAGNASSGEGEGEEDDDFVDDDTRPRTRQRAASATLVPRRTRRKGKMPVFQEDSEEEEEDDAASEESEEEAAEEGTTESSGGARRPRQSQPKRGQGNKGKGRPRRQPRQQDVREEEEEEDEEEENKSGRAVRRKGKKSSGATNARIGKRKAKATTKAAASARSKKQRTTQKEAPRQSRPASCFEWLLATEVEEHPEQFIPQLGEEVVYFRQGHAFYLEHSRDGITKPPYKQLRKGAQLRAWELCRVEDLQYHIDANTNETVCMATLELTDDSGPCDRQSFKLEICQRMRDHPEFLIPRAKFDQGMRRRWLKGNKGLMAFRTVENGCISFKQWHIEVVDVCFRDPAFKDSPWESVHVVSHDGDEDWEDRCNPWELMRTPQDVWTPATLDAVVRNRVLENFAEAERLTAEAREGKNQQEPAYLFFEWFGKLEDMLDLPGYTDTYVLPPPASPASLSPWPPASSRRAWKTGSTAPPPPSSTTWTS